MIRTVVGSHQGANGDWVAELSCGHQLHLHHRPPFPDPAGALDPAGAADRLDTPLACPHCERAELVGPRSSSRSDAEGGDPACWAGLLCPKCGIVLDGSPHRADCRAPGLD